MKSFKIEKIKKLVPTKKLIINKQLKAIKGGFVIEDDIGSF